jgi:hypothetical protein
MGTKNRLTRKTVALPFLEREKATIIKCLRPCREAWEKVAEGRMRALMKETTPC